MYALHDAKDENSRSEDQPKVFSGLRSFEETQQDHRDDTVLNELAEELNFRNVGVDLFKNIPISVIQRLGYLLEELDYKELANELFGKIKDVGILFRKAPLKAGKDSKDCDYDAKWRIIINEKIEIDE